MSYRIVAAVAVLLATAWLSLYNPLLWVDTARLHSESGFFIARSLVEQGEQDDAGTRG